MTDPNFTTTGQPQNLPGMDVPFENTQGSVPSDNENSVENVVNVPPSTTPPRVQVESPAPDEDERNHRTTIAYGIAVVFLVIVLIFGIMLIVWAIPKIVGSLKNSNKSTISTTSATASSTEGTHTTPVITTISYTTATSTATSTNSTKKVVVSGPADLRVQILSVNKIGDTISVRFNVQNIGHRASGNWTFSASLPSSITPIYHSEIQSSITPQSGFIYTLGFTPAPSQSGQISIRLFPQSGDASVSNNFSYYNLY